MGAVGSYVKIAAAVKSKNHFALDHDGVSALSSPVMRRIWLLVACAALCPAVGRPACNVVVSAARSFPSRLGATATPFGQPGQVVTVSREKPTFSSLAVGNRIKLDVGSGVHS